MCTSSLLVTMRLLIVSSACRLLACTQSFGSLQGQPQTLTASTYASCIILAGKPSDGSPLVLLSAVAFGALKGCLLASAGKASNASPTLHNQHVDNAPEAAKALSQFLALHHATLVVRVHQGASSTARYTYLPIPRRTARSRRWRAQMPRGISPRFRESDGRATCGS